MKKKFTKYPQSRVTASKINCNTGKDYTDGLASAICWATEVSTQTALDLINYVGLTDDDLIALGFDKDEYPELYGLDEE